MVNGFSILKTQDEPLTIATMLWDSNEHSEIFSSMYDESWVEKLYWGFRRNLSVRFRFVCFTDYVRQLPQYIHQESIMSKPPAYAAYTEPYRLNVPMILVGLDTMIVRNIDHLADYCFRADKIALPLAIYRRNTVCNGVALVPEGMSWVYEEWDGKKNDMAIMRNHYRKGHINLLEEQFPGQVLSYKKHIKPNLDSLGQARIVFFHGQEKPHQLDLPWIKEHWRIGL